MRTSSIKHTTPFSPSRILVIHFWNNSGTLDIPNGSLKRPYGVMNVVSSLDSSASGICQNPLLASNLLNILAPVSRARVSSTLGMG